MVQQNNVVHLWPSGYGYDVHDCRLYPDCAGQHDCKCNCKRLGGVACGIADDREIINQMLAVLSGVKKPTLAGIPTGGKQEATLNILPASFNDWRM